jgi:hydrogenase 3 maturation protease
MKQADPFRQMLRGKVVIVGVGNILRGDDGLGPMLVERLKDKVRALCINAGSTLENYLGKIIKAQPDTVLLIDAVHLGLQPGAYEMVEAAEIKQTGLSTHDISPRLLLDLLGMKIRGKIFLLGIQPQQLGLGNGVSRRIKKTLLELEQRIVRALIKKKME